MIVHNLTIFDSSGKILDEFGFSRGEIIIGRSEECDVRLDSNTVSRKHARMRVEGPQCSVEDFGSSNGVFVNERRLTGPVLLPPEATIVVGEFVLKYESHSADTSGRESLPPAFIPPWFLIRIGDHLEGEYFELAEPEMTLGRTESNSLQVLDPSVSRVHATLRLQGDHFVLVDNRSANGTRVNGLRAERPLVLREGDRVTFGDIRFAVTSDPTNFRFDDDDRGSTSITRPTPGRSGSPILLIAGAASLFLIVGAILLLLFAVERSDGIPQAPEPEELAAQESSRGQRALEQGDWMVAIAAFESALLASPSTEMEESLEHARAELAADDRLSACGAQLEAAVNLEGSGQTLAAAETYEDSRRCFLDISDQTRAHSIATTRVQNQIDPALATLYRQLGVLALQGNDHASAVQSLERAVSLLEELPNTDVPEGLHSRYREALIGAADAAFEEEAWTRAADLYRRAHRIRALDTAASRRMTRAESRAN